MNIGIDIDDTITNSSDLFIKYARKFNKKYKVKYKINKYSLDSYNAFGWSKNLELKFKNEYLLSVLQNAKVNKNCVSVIKYMKRKGCKIFLITARSDDELEGMYDISYTWLKKNHIKFDKLVINSKSKMIDCKDNNIDLFFDDNVNTCVNIIKQLDIPTYVYSTRYNKDYKYNKVKNWKEIEKIFRKEMSIYEKK